MTLFEPKIKKTDLAILFENISFLLSCGYNSYDAVYWVCQSTMAKKRDKEGKRIRYLGESLLKDLSEGFSLSTAMLHNPKYYEEYAKQVQSGEESGRLPQVLDQIVQSIRESDTLKHKIRSAMMYPAFVLVITFGVAWYLFSFVIPDILDMLADVGGGEIPTMTRIVMNITEWMKVYALPVIILVFVAILLIVFLGKGPMKKQFHKAYTRLPLISKISIASNVCTWMQSLRYMLAAGSPTAQAMSAAADTMTNIYLREQANEAYYLYASSGIPVPEALKKCTFLSAIELSTINIGLESGTIEEVLKRLAARKKDETEKAINAFTTALNPIVICVLGVVVGVIVMAVYGPLINVTSIISGA